VRRGSLSVGVVIVVLAAACTGGGAAGASTLPAPTASSAPASTPAATRAAPVATATAPPPASAAAPSSTPAGAATALYDPTANARADIEAALAAAKADGKRVLIDYGADWCPDCHSLAAIMEGAAGRPLIEPAFHVVRVDVGMWDHNLDVAKEYGNAIWNGIPAVVALDANGKIVGSSADGSLANARAMTEEEVLTELAAWVE
jgi:thiol-disulfide isomerase/thioredoxin